MPFVRYIASAGGISPPSPGLNSLADELSSYTLPFFEMAPICISKDGSTVFAFGLDSGGAYGVWVWRWNGTNWPNLQILTFSTSGDFSGWSGGLQAWLMTMTLRCNEDGSKAYMTLPAANGADGVVYVWHESAGTWSQVARLTPPSGGLAGRYGAGFACDNTGSRIAIGEPNIDLGGVFNRGQVHVMTESGGSYTLEQTILDTATDGNDVSSRGTWFGAYCGLSGAGDVLIVGGRYRWGPTFNGAGLLESYTRSGTSWSLEAHHYPSDDDFVLHECTQNTIAISEDASIILWSRRDSQFGPGYPSTGHYTRSGGAFSFQSLIYLGPLADFVGIGDCPLRMSADGSVAIYGSYNDSINGTNDGTVRVWSGPSSWASVTDIVAAASPTPNTYRMGRGADISGDGSIVVWTRGGFGTPDPELVFMRVF